MNLNLESFVHLNKKTQPAAESEASSGYFSIIEWIFLLYEFGFLRASSMKKSPKCLLSDIDD